MAAALSPADEDTAAILQTLTEQNAFVKRLPDGVTLPLPPHDEGVRRAHASARWSRRRQAALLEPLSAGGTSTHGQYLHALARLPSGAETIDAAAARHPAATRASCSRRSAPEDVLDVLDALPGGTLEGAPACAPRSDAQHVQLAADPEDAGAARNCCSPRSRNTPDWPDERARQPARRVRPHHELSAATTTSAP